MNDSIFLIDIVRLDTLQSDGRIKIKLPGEQDILFAEVESVDITQDSSTIAWYGHFECLLGDVFLLASDTSTIGYMTYDNFHYSIEQLCGGQYVLIKSEVSEGEEDCKTEEHIEINSPLSGGTVYPTSDVCVTSVLVLYTEEAQQYSSIEYEAKIGIETMNQSMRNSEVNHRVYLAATEQLLGNYTEAGATSTTMFLTRLQDPNYTYDDFLRFIYKADLVILLVRADDLQNNLTYGQAWVQDGVAVVRTGSMDRFSFGYEIGHLYNCKHQNTSSAGQYNRAFEFTTGFSGTLMRDVSRRILNFSNPDIEGTSTYDGSLELIGQDGFRDNSRNIEDVACDIASTYNYDWVNCDDLPRLSIIGPDSPIQVGNSYTWCLEEFSCPTGNVLWDYSTNGFDWKTVSPTNNCVTITPVVNHITVRAKTSCLDNGCGLIGTNIISRPKPEDCYEYRLQSNLSELEKNAPFILYPYPAINDLIIELSAVLKSEYKITIYNHLGKIIDSKNISSKNQNSNFINLDISGLNSGLHYLKISNSTVSHCESFIHVN